MKTRSTILLIGVALVISLGAGFGEPARADGREPSRTALMVFVDYEDRVEPSLPVSDLRLGGASGLGDWLEGQGHEVLTYPEIEPIMRAWQIRSALDLPYNLLPALGAEHSIDYLMIVRLVLYPDRVLLLGRGLARNSGYLCWASTVEISLPSEFWIQEEGTAEAWNNLIATASAQFTAHWPDAASETPGSTLVLLPLRPVGLGSESADIATHSILGSLLETKLWQIPDPAMVRSVLRDGGHDPRRLDEAGRAELSIWFDPVALLVPNLLSFETLVTRAVPFVVEDAAPTKVALAAEAKVPLYLQVLLLDCGTGRVRSAMAAYLKPDDPTGLFGFDKTVPLARRFEFGADQIVEKLKRTGGKI